MINILTMVFPYFFAAIMVSAIYWFYLSKKVFKALEMNHPGEYERLGKPSVAKNTGVDENYPLARFIWKKKYKDLNDVSLNKLCDRMRTFLVIYLYACSAFFMFYVIALITDR